MNEPGIFSGFHRIISRAGIWHSASISVLHRIVAVAVGCSGAATDAARYIGMFSGKKNEVLCCRTDRHAMTAIVTLRGVIEPVSSVRDSQPQEGVRIAKIQNISKPSKVDATWKPCR